MFSIIRVLRTIFEYQQIFGEGLTKAQIVSMMDDRASDIGKAYKYITENKLVDKVGDKVLVNRMGLKELNEA